MEMNEKNVNTFKKIDRVVFKTTKCLSYISAVALVLVALICTIDVVGLKLFGTGIRNGTDIVTYLNIPVVFMAIAFIQVERGHTSIDLLVSRFPKVVQRIISTVGNLLGAVVCGFVSWRIVLLTIDKFEKLSKASAGRYSFVIWPFAAIVAIGFALLALAMLWCVVRDLTIPKEEQCGFMPMEMNFGDEENNAEEEGAE